MEGKLRLEVWAGSLGVPLLRKELDAANLQPHDQAELQRLISASGVRDLPELPSPPPQLRDANQIKIVFDNAEKKQTVRFEAEGVSSALRNLIDFLKAHGS